MTLLFVTIDKAGGCVLFSSAVKGFDGKQVEARMLERELPAGERHGAKRLEYISGAAR